MISKMREDMRVNDDAISKIVVINYRFGNWVFYEVKTPIVRQLLGVCYKVSNLVIRMTTGSEIPARCKIGRAFRIEHGGKGLVINPKVIIGNNARIFHQVTIGTNPFDYIRDPENYFPPQLGDNVFIGVGAKIIGNIQIGDNARIGANAVANFNVPINATVAVTPATMTVWKG